MRLPRPSSGFVRLLAIVLGVLLVGPFATLHWMERQQFVADAKGLEREIARSKAMGLRLEPKPGPSTLQEENAAPIYAMAQRAFDSMADDYQSALEYGYPTPTKELIASAVRVAEPVFRAIEAAVEKPACVFPQSGNPFGSGPLSHSLVKVCTNRANLMARNGRLDEALRTLEVAAGMTRQARGGDQVAFEAGRADREVIESMLLWAADLVTSEQIRRARGVIERLGPTDPLAPLREDLVLRYTIYRWLDDIPDELRETPMGRIERVVTGGDAYFDVGLFRPPLHDAALVERAFRARVLRRWNDFFEAALLHLGDYAALRKDLEALDDSIRRGTHRVDEAERSMGFAMRPYWDAAMERQTQVRVALASLAVLEHRRRTGRLPDRLDLVGSWIDPVDGKPLRYIRKGKGFVLYSVGPDGADNGGKAGGGVRGYDVVAAIGLPPKTPVDPASADR